jgi:hypothetical protein
MLGGQNGAKILSESVPIKNAASAAARYAQKTMTALYAAPLKSNEPVEVMVTRLTELIHVTQTLELKPRDLPPQRHRHCRKAPPDEQYGT